MPIFSSNMSRLFWIRTGLVSLMPRSLAFNIIKRLTIRKFPAVQWINTEDVARWLEDSEEPQPVFLDARTEAEYAVSHLKQAQRIEPNHLEQAVLPSKDMPIIVYCSVGYRSARIAQQLEQAGFSRVYNLEGSLFKWANEERPVFKNDHPTLLVHPYNQLWGKLLQPKYRAKVNENQKRVSA